MHPHSKRVEPNRTEVLQQYTKTPECTSASRSKDLPKGPSTAAAAASVDDVGGSAVTTAAGVIVVAALANTGTLAWRRLRLNAPARALRGCTAIGPTLNRLLDVCMCALMYAVVYIVQGMLP